MSTEVAASAECTAEPPHRFAIGERLRVGNGILVTLSRVDEPYPPRDVFVTNREMKMGYENVYKACFVCVDQGVRENAIALPKDQIEAGLPLA
ncbi:MAG: hypothetical protein DMF54_11775 [Acidobacteria bacterium]|nr:MAG: hypothetical protein DMF55_01015 [Acidobacteriota bacterium]PYQ65231.1 MAG: hypothetical protein DMF54_11775 [Acidobacteriota bacterium]